MNFSEIAKNRQSCRSYDGARAVEQEKIDAILESARLAPSACNSQPYHITVCLADSARAVARATGGMGMNKFALDAPVMLVISEDSYSATAALGARVKKNDYRSIDIGILSAYVTAEAAAQGLGSCIIGWFDNAEIKKICDIKEDVRLVISIGYASEGDPLREKKRKDISKLATYKY
jgi:nitroreductase